MKYSFDVARGKMTPAAMGYELSKEIIVSAAAIGGGLALQSVVPVAGYLLGSFLGSVIASTVLDFGEKVFLSSCADSGFACFGLVDQDYKLPPEVLEYIGLDIIELKQKDAVRCEIPRIEIGRVNLNSVSYNTIEIMALMRGVVGINRIAYVM